MGKTSRIRPVKLIMGAIIADEGLFKEIEPCLVEQWGGIDGRSGLIPFDFTDYYRQEMGAALLRQWLSFAGLVGPEDIAAIKLKTNEIEKKFSAGGRRRVNLDPGYMDGARLILASTKDYSHRIYLSGGIYAEVTLIYEKGKFRALPWTYPDYRSDSASSFFMDVRGRYIKTAQP